MNPSTELLDYELRRTHTTTATDRDASNRAAVRGARRTARRHRLADRVRAVADRLDS